MANIITAGNSTNGGTAITTDTSGTLNIVTGSGSGSNAITIDASQNVVVNGNMSFNSGYGSAAVAYGCRAWVNFNGTGTVAIRGSGNVTSITDNGTGDYTVNFTTAMTDANYAPTCSYAPTLNGSGAAARVVYIYSTGTTGLRITSKDNAGSGSDFESMNVAIFR